MALRPNAGFAYDSLLHDSSLICARHQGSVLLQQLAAGGGHGVPNWEDFEQIHLAKQAEDEHTEKLTRAEELKKRNEHRKETEAQMRAEWMEEVNTSLVTFVTSSIWLLLPAFGQLPCCLSA